MKMPRKKHYKSESPLTDFKDDLFGYKDLSQKLLDNVLLKTELPNCFGLYGNWGSGKSTMIKFILNHLEKKKYDKIRSFYFEPWKYEYAQTNDLFFALLNELRASLKIKDRPWKKIATSALTVGAWSLKAMTSALPLVPEINTKEIKENAEMFESMLYKKYETWSDETMNFHKLLNDTISNELAEDEKLIIFVDDLDRCLPENAVSLLEAIKNFLNIEKTLFVVAIDRRIMGTMISEKYDIFSEYGEEYLMKIIPYYYTLPKPELTSIVKEILAQHKITLDDRSEAYIASFLKDLAPEPRRAKHYLNQFCTKINLGSIELKSEEEIVLHWVTIFLMTKYPSFFNDEGNIRRKLINVRDTAQQVQRGSGAATTYDNIKKTQNIPNKQRKIFESVFSRNSLNQNNIFEPDKIFNVYNSVKNL